MRISVLLHQSFAKSDAITTDITSMYAILKRKFETFVYSSDGLYGSLSGIKKENLLNAIINKENLLIYHHDMYWEEGANILEQAKAKVIVKYHRLSSETYCKASHEEYDTSDHNRRAQTARIYQDHPDFLWVGDSLYALEDIGIADRTNTVVVPPFNHIEMWQSVSPDEATLKSLLEGRTINLLFVGNLALNRGYNILIEILRDYIRYYGEDIVLHIVGKKNEELQKLNLELEQHISFHHGLEKHVHWMEKIPKNMLLSFFLGCDYYLHVNDDESFCVPLLEAQSLYLPVIAKRTRTVAEILGQEQLLLDGDIREYSSAIRIISRNKAYKDYLVKKGIKNYRNRFTNQIIEKQFTETVQNFTGVSL